MIVINCTLISNCVCGYAFYGMYGVMVTYDDVESYGQSWIGWTYVGPVWDTGRVVVTGLGGRHGKYVNVLVVHIHVTCDMCAYRFHAFYFYRYVYESCDDVYIDIMF